MFENQNSGYVFWGWSSVKAYTCSFSAQISLKDYSFYIFHPILMKLDTYHHWVNVLPNCVQIKKNATHGIPERGTQGGKLGQIFKHYSTKYPHNMLYYSCVQFDDQTIFRLCILGSTFSINIFVISSNWLKRTLFLHCPSNVD